MFLQVVRRFCSTRFWTSRSSYPKIDFALCGWNFARYWRNLQLVWKRLHDSSNDRSDSRFSKMLHHILEKCALKALSTVWYGCLFPLCLQWAYRVVCLDEHLLPTYAKMSLCAKWRSYVLVQAARIALEGTNHRMSTSQNGFYSFKI